MFYVELLKALYFVLRHTTRSPTVLGKVERKDSCAVNKMINGKQCSIGLHVDH